MLYITSLSLSYVRYFVCPPPLPHIAPFYPSPWASQVALVIKNPSASTGNTRDSVSIPASGRSPGRGHGNTLQYSCLENPMDGGGWQDMVHRVAKSWTHLNWLSTHPSPHQPLVCSPCLWICFFCVIFTSLLCFLNSIYKWYHVAFIFVLFFKCVLIMQFSDFHSEVGE